MTSIALHRLGSGALILVMASMVVFGLVELIPGDPAITLAGENASPERIQATRERLNLDDSLLSRYGRWVGSAATGDLGSSLYNDSRSITTAIGERLPASASLIAGALVVGVLVGVPAGMIAGVRRGTLADRLSTVMATAGVAFPNYWLGLLLLLPFALWNPWLPATGYVPLDEDPLAWLRHLILPAVTLGLAPAAVVTRQLRSSMHDVMLQDYIRTAHAKGMPARLVVGKHALKNAFVPTLTVLGAQVARLLGGTIIVEQVFGIAGIGQLAITAVLSGDLPMIQGIVLLSVVFVVVSNLLIDFGYAWLNPKVRFG